MDKQYGIHSEFHIEKHKAAFTNYLEVLIAADGTIMYAVPSHQELLIKLACERLGVTRDELKTMCPRKYYVDYMRWLCLLTGAMAVWNDYCEYGIVSVAQLGALRKLKMAGLYKGMLPSPPQTDTECNMEDLIQDPKDHEEDHKELEQTLSTAISLLRTWGEEG